MNPLLIKALGALTLAASLIAFPAAAQTSGRPGFTEPGPGPIAGNCSAARDPVRCEAILKVKEECRDLRGAKKRACWEDNAPPADCSKAKFVKRCEARVAAQAACKGTVGVARRNCKRQAIKQASVKK